MKKCITTSQESKKMAYENWKPSEIPRSWLENICYSKNPITECKYRNSKDCPKVCIFLPVENTRINRGYERFMQKYPNYLAESGLVK